MPLMSNVSPHAHTRFSEQDAFVEIELLELTDAEPAHGDALLGVRMHSAGFSGSTEVWVLQEQLRLFCSSLVKLEQSLRGQAMLESVSPGELELKVFSVSLRGHVAVEGSLFRITENGCIGTALRSASSSSKRS